MPFFQLRITFSEVRTKDICVRALWKLVKHYALTEHSCGIEELNKYGEPCDPHIHFNFIADIDRVNPKRCIQDWLRRWFIKRDVELKGNKMWSLQMVEEPKDYDKWYRYPLKENSYALLCKITDLSGVELHSRLADLRIRAMDERKTSIEHNILRREKLRLKDQFKIKLYEYVGNPQNSSKRSIWCLIFKYYREIEKPINFSVIEGYTNLWLADHGQLSAESAFDLAHNNNDN